MKPVTINEARTRTCPFTISTSGYAPSSCIADKCMAWKVVREYCEVPESAGSTAILNEAVKTNRIMQRKPGNHNGDTRLYLEEEGVCARCVITIST